MPIQEIDLVKDSTLQDVANSLRKIAGITDAPITSFKDVKGIVNSGNYKNVFAIGDQLITEWTDITNGQKYQFPFNVVNYASDEITQDGRTVEGLTLQALYTIPFTIQFSNYQAFYSKEQELPAGTYHVTMGFNWGSNVVNGKSYQFTLTQPVPANGQLSGFESAPDRKNTEWRVKSWASNTATSPIETVTVTEGTGGTFLGTFTAAGNEDINSLYQTAYGNNSYYHSAYRQWLNSEKPVGQWWKPMSKYDRCPDQLANKAGFLTGFNDDFKSAISPSKVVTELNTVTTLNNSSLQSFCYDKMFLPSLEEMAVNPQIRGEGSMFEYWKRMLVGKAPIAQYSTHEEMKHYSVANHASAQTVRLRSASRGNGDTCWVVHSSGNVGNANAVCAYACAPACKILQS